MRRRRALCLIGIAALVAAAPSPAPAIQQAHQAIPRYFDVPCRDQNQDGIDDFFDTLTGLSSVDVMVVFNDTGYDAATAGAAIAAVLAATQPSADVHYVSTWSPYVFIRGIALANPASSTPSLNGILATPEVVGVRAYERFSQFTRRRQPLSELHPGIFLPEDDAGHSQAPKGGALPIEPHLIPPGVVVYFVDSGIAAPGYWGIDVTANNPLAPTLAVDPPDVSSIHHGSFLKSLAGFTAQQGQLSGGGDPIQFADVNVAFGPNGETTTEELTKAFDAIMAHVQHQRNHGKVFDVVVNISYDTDGGIANHDIIYPAPEGLPDHAVRRRPPAEPAWQPARTAGGDPCAVTLFDRVYRLLSTQYGAVICVGAGNDGAIAPFAINEVGQSAHTTLVVSALDQNATGPAPYSNFAHAPDGLNGHPDLMAPGTSGAPGYPYLLEGTSVSTALASAMSAVKFSRTGGTAPGAIVNQLIADGFPLPPFGGKYYGEAILKLPWTPIAPPIEGAETARDDLRLKASPNPARPVTRLSATLDAPGFVRVEIFDVAGRLRRRIAEGPAPAGRSEWVFDGRDDVGDWLPGGVYFARVGAGRSVSVTRILLAPR